MLNATIKIILSYLDSFKIILLHFTKLPKNPKSQHIFTILIQELLYLRIDIQNKGKGINTKKQQPQPRIHRKQLWKAADKLRKNIDAAENKQIASQYSAGGRISLTYRFGSIYNNVVNPRFGNGGGGYGR